jgi:prepilin-type N-terminal cleavage/methylation domain-containing protein
VNTISTGRRIETGVIFVRLQNQKGFTLAELIVAAALSLSLLAAVYGVFRVQTHTIKGQESRMEAHEYAMAVLDIMVREIRNTGYFPTRTACATTPANTAGIIAATAQSFRLVYDTNGDGACEEDVSFTYDATNKNILRNGAPLTDGNATAIQFTYYPQQTSATAPAPYCVSAGNPSGCSGDLAVNLSAVQKIMISITVQSKNTDVQFGGLSNITMSSSADLRNHNLPS